jgi:glycerol-3-phosphate acyltransferase PlsY
VSSSLLVAVDIPMRDIVTSVALGVVGALVGYLIGSINPAAIIARVRGIDLRAIGSGNPGATNAGRAFGWPVGILVAVLDIAKGFVPVFLLDHFGYPVPALVAGLCAVVGHISSPWLHGRGGKGVATSLGAVLAVQPWWALPVIGVFLVVFLITRRVGLSSVAGSLMLVPASIVRHDRPADIVFAVALAGIVVVRHRRNLVEAAEAVTPPRP